MDYFNQQIVLRWERTATIFYRNFYWWKNAFEKSIWPKGPLSAEGLHPRCFGSDRERDPQLRSLASTTPPAGSWAEHSPGDAPETEPRSLAAQPAGREPTHSSWHRSRRATLRGLAQMFNLQLNS